MKKIRKKKSAHPRKPAADEREAPFLTRLESTLKGNYQHAVIVGVIILFAIVFVPVYRHYSQARQAEALRAVEQALASETIEARLSLLQNVVDEYGSTLSGVRALYHLGNAYYESGQYDPARQRYEQFLRKYPRAQFSPNAQEGLAYVAESEGKFDEAVKHYMTLIEIYGDSYLAQHAWYNIGRCYEQTGDWVGAIDGYEKQVSLFPMSAWTDKAEARLGEIRFKLLSAQTRAVAEEASIPPDPAEIAGAD